MLLCFILYRLIQQMESYSLSLNNTSVVKPNVAVQTVLFSTKSTVLFSVKKGEVFISCTYDSREHSAINHEQCPICENVDLKFYFSPSHRR